MKDFLIGFKLVKYGNRAKMLLISGILFLVLGVIIEILNKGANPIGIIYLEIISGMIIQSAISVEGAEFFLASPKMKMLQTKAPTYMYLTLLTGVQIVSVAIKYYMMKFQGLEEYTACGTLLFGSAFIIITLLYYAFAYKYMVVSTIFFVVVAMPSMMIIQRPAFMLRFDRLFSIGFWPAAGLGYAMTLFAILLYYIISCLLYKKPYSKYALRGMYDNTAK